MNKRFLIFHPAVAPYRVDFFNALHDRLGAVVSLYYKNLKSQKFDYEKLKERFGEADESTETKRTVNDVPTTYSNHYWNYTTPDGKKTQLQWAAAYISGEKEPTYVALGTVWLDPPAKES